MTKVANLTEGVLHFFKRQNFVIVSTIDKDGTPHNSCKGIVDIDKENRIYLLDVYKAKTYDNLKRNSNISITAVDEHKFTGFCLKGNAEIIKSDKSGAVGKHIKAVWDEKVTQRITHRIIKNIKGEKGHAKHPEALLPKPEYIIRVNVAEVIDLTPQHIKEDK